SLRCENLAGMVWTVAPIGPGGPALGAAAPEATDWPPLFGAGDVPCGAAWLAVWPAPWPVPWPADEAPVSGIISAARASSCVGCWLCGSGGALLQGCAAWPGLI